MDAAPGGDRLENAPQAEMADQSLAVMYSVTGRLGGQPMSGNATLDWTVRGKAYVLTLRITGTRRFDRVLVGRLTSTGSLSQGRLHPEAYDEEVTTVDGGSHASKASFDGGSYHEDAVSGPPPLDPLGAIFQIANDLSHPNTAPSSSLPVTLRHGTGMTNLRLDPAGNEALGTPFGILQTEKFVTSYPSDWHEEPVTTIWLAPAYRYMPVKMTFEFADTATLTLDLASNPVAFPALN